MTITQDPRPGHVYVRSDRPQNGELVYHNHACPKVSWPGLAPGAYVEVDQAFLSSRVRQCRFNGGGCAQIDEKVKSC